MVGIRAENLQSPLGHDVMMALIKAGNLKLEKIIIHSIEQNTFRAVLKLGKCNSNNKKDINNSQIEIDARPSDAIALALRSKCSIWMLENVVASASIAVDADADAEDQNQFNEFIDKISPASLIQHLNERKGGNNESSDPSTKKD